MHLTTRLKPLLGSTDANPALVLMSDYLHLGTDVKHCILDLPKMFQL